MVKLLILRIFRLGYDSSDQVITEYSMNLQNVADIPEDVLRSHRTILINTQCILHFYGTLCPGRLVK